MTLEPLLTGLTEKGITLEAEGGTLRVKPASRLDPATLELLKTYKSATLALLEPSPAHALITKTGSCFSNGAGKRFALDLTYNGKVRI